MLLLCFFVVSYSQPANAWSCIFHTPSNIELIHAPIIFEGKVTDKVTKADKNYYRYTVTKLYKGPKTKTIDILGGDGDFDPKTAKNYRTSILLPRKTKSGDLFSPRCSPQIKLSSHAAVKIKLAYQTPFPTMFLIFTARETHLFLGIIFLVLIGIVTLRRGYIYIRRSDKKDLYKKDYFFITCVFLAVYTLYMIAVSYIYFSPYTDAINGLRGIAIGLSIVFGLSAIYNKHYNGSIWFMCVPHIYTLILLMLSSNSLPYLRNSILALFTLF